MVSYESVCHSHTNAADVAVLCQQHHDVAPTFIPRRDGPTVCAKTSQVLPRNDSLIHMLLRYTARNGKTPFLDKSYI